MQLTDNEKQVKTIISKKIPIYPKKSTDVEQDSAALTQTRFRECPAQGEYSANGLTALTLACRPEYVPDMLLALS